MVIDKLHTLPKPWGIYVNTASSLALLSLYVTTGDKRFYTAILDKNWYELLQMGDMMLPSEVELLLAYTIMKRIKPSEHWVLYASYTILGNGDVIPSLSMTNGLLRVIATDEDTFQSIISIDPVTEGTFHEGMRICDAKTLIADPLYWNMVSASDDEFRIHHPSMDANTLNRVLEVNSDFPSILGTQSSVAQDVFILKEMRVMNYILHGLKPSGC